MMTCQVRTDAVSNCIANQHRAADLPQLSVESAKETGNYASEYFLTIAYADLVLCGCYAKHPVRTL